MQHFTKTITRFCSNCGEPDERSLSWYKLNKDTKIICFNCKKERVRKTSRLRYYKQKEIFLKKRWQEVKNGERLIVGKLVLPKD